VIVGVAKQLRGWAAAGVEIHEHVVEHERHHFAARE
jgi:hypothetical protein